jgi:serine protease Do
MFFANFTTARMRRRAIFSSAAVAALAAAAALGVGALLGSDVALAATQSTTDLQGPSLPSLAPLVDRVKPAVVSIKVDSINDDSNSAKSDQSDGVPSEIQQSLERLGEQSSARQGPVAVEGSGFFISSDGYIVTNKHLVQNAKSVAVTMMDGKTLDAEVVGGDARTNIAVLKVRERADYPFVTFSKQPAKIGDWVVAIGNPNVVGAMVAAGIVAGEGGDTRDGSYGRFLQIDAPFNRGNLGGPAFNMQGEVVGMNSAIHSPLSGSVGVGLAVPASTVEFVANALEHGSVVPHSYLGVSVQPLTPTMAESIGLKSPSGVIVLEAISGTPAAEAGLKSGDIITKLNGKAIEDAGDFARRIDSFKPGDKVELTFVRDDAEKTLEATLGEHKTSTVATKAENTDAAQNEATPTLGVALARANEITGAGDKGVAIVGIDPDGAAAAEGLTAGDVILDIAGKPVSTPEDVKSGLASAKSQGKKGVLMRVQTADGERYVAVPFPEA